MYFCWKIPQYTSVTRLGTLHPQRTAIFFRRFHPDVWYSIQPPQQSRQPFTALVFIYNLSAATSHTSHGLLVPITITITLAPLTGLSGLASTRSPLSFLFFLIASTTSRFLPAPPASHLICTSQKVNSPIDGPKPV